MQIRDPERLEIPGQPESLDQWLESIPNTPAVFLLHAREGQPYFARTTLLRRRLKRLLRTTARSSRLLNLFGTAVSVEYWLTASRLELALLSWEVARRHFPETYPHILRLHMPSYVKVVLANRFPRTQLTTRIGSSRSLYYGPFRSRVAAEQFESQFLDFFQVRRCQEDLDPSPEHPGCIYGEMNMCLRPCQEVVGEEEYRSEVNRLVEFLAQDGRPLVHSIAASRDRLSQELYFEEAAREHKRLEKVQQVLRLREDLVRDIDRISGVAVTQSIAADSVELWFLIQGSWQAPHRFCFAQTESKAVSLDQKLREIVAGFLNHPPRHPPSRERQEHLALLARWYYSSSRDGEWLSFDSLQNVPYRKLVNAIHRIATGGRPEPSSEAQP